MTAWTETSGGQSAATSVGVGGQVGASVASAATITVTEFVTEITGSTSISTINGLESGRMYILIPATGASWSFATGGNILSSYRGAVGVPIIIVKHGSSVRIENAITAALPFINPMDAPYNAVGDGTADDTTALAAAIVAAGTAHTTLQLPAGKTFRITSTITALLNNWAIRGNGGLYDRPTIKVDGNITGLALGNAGTIVEGMTISGVKFQGVNGGTSQRAIDVSNTRMVSVTSNYFTGFAGNAIYATGGSADRTFLGYYADNFFNANTNSPINMRKAGGTAGNWFEKNKFAGNTLSTSQYSIEYVGFTHSTFYDNDFEDTVTPGTNAAIFASFLYLTRFINNRCESRSFINCDGTIGLCGNNTIENNFVYNAGTVTAVFGSGFQDSRFLWNLLDGAAGSTGFSITNTTGRNLFQGNSYSAGFTTQKSLHASSYNFDHDVMFRARASTIIAQSIPNAAVTLLTWEVEDWDHGGVHSTASNTGRMTVTAPGRVALHAQVGFATNVTGFRTIQIRKNGTLGIGRATMLPVNDVSIFGCSGDDICVTGDYYEVLVYQSSGGALALDVSVTGENFFEIKKEG